MTTASRSTRKTAYRPSVLRSRKGPLPVYATTGAGPSTWSAPWPFARDASALEREPAVPRLEPVAIAQVRMDELARAPREPDVRPEAVGPILQPRRVIGARRPVEGDRPPRPEPERLRPRRRDEPRVCWRMGSRPEREPLDVVRGRHREPAPRGQGGGERALGARDGRDDEGREGHEPARCEREAEAPPRPARSEARSQELDDQRCDQRDRDREMSALGVVAAEEEEAGGEDEQGQNHTNKPRPLTSRREPLWSPPPLWGRVRVRGRPDRSET